MQKIILVAIFAALTGCQVTVRTQGPATAPAPVQTTQSAQPIERKLPATPLVSGVYIYQSAHTKNKDGKGKIQQEFNKFTYTIRDMGNGQAFVKYEGSGQVADPGGFGGILAGGTEGQGIAVFTGDNWLLKSQPDEGQCESHFIAEGNTVRHLSSHCNNDIGRLESLGWASDNTVLRFSRPLKNSELVNPTHGPDRQKVAAAAPIKNNDFNSLIGKTFPTFQLPYLAYGFDPFNEKRDRITAAEMPEGKVIVYPVRKGSTRYIVVAARIDDNSNRITDIRTVAPGIVNEQFVAVTPTGGDTETSCTLNGKKVNQVFGYAMPGKKQTFTGHAAATGESIWLIQPGGINVIALTRHETLVCTSTSFAG